MTLNEYQQKAKETADYKQKFIYPSLGLAGEAGEVVDKVKKVLRDHNEDFTDPALRYEIAKELGDVLWYIAMLSHDLGYELETIAQINYEKLRSRKLRGKINGNGDNR